SAGDAHVEGANITWVRSAHDQILVIRSRVLRDGEGTVAQAAQVHERIVRKECSVVELEPSGEARGAKRVGVLPGRRNAVHKQLVETVRSAQHAACRRTIE